MTGQVILLNGGSYSNSGSIAFTNNSLESTSSTNPADITNSGSIVATDQSGTAVYLEDGGEVTNNAGATIGSSTTGGDGILTGPDTGATTVTNDGSIYGVNGTAVSLAGDGTLSNDDLIQGDSGVSIAGAGKMVTNNKTITATTGIGVSIGNGGTVVNATGAAISGGSGGISIASGSGTSQGTVTNSGSIVATDQSGTAVYLEDGGEVTNNAGATIGSSTTGGDGILTGPDTGATTVTNDGSIYGVNGTAVSLAGDGTLSNDDLIQGDSGVSIAGAGKMVTNNKTITATTGIGVSIGNGGTVVNATGAAISGGSGGISIASGSGTSQGTVTNSGSIVATDQSGTAVYLEDGGEVTNNAGATIGSSTTGGDGILTGPDTGATTVTNDGSIYGVNGTAVSLAGDGTLSNDDLIQGDSGVSIAGAGKMVTNNKTITATTGIGVSIGNGGTVVNATGAAISGGSGGISIASGSGTSQGTVTNSGSIVATDQSGTAVYLEDGGEVTNNAGATIGSSTTGGDGILTGPDTGATTVTNDGSIYGVNGTAVSLAGEGTLSNDDLIQGDSGVSIAGVGKMVTNNKTITATTGIGVSIGDGGTVVNATGAAISGGSAGISIASGSGTSQGTVTNSGSIVATDQSGTAVYLEDGGEVTNNAGATIGSSTTGGDGILTGPDTGETTLTNFGTINGFNGDAVSFAGEGNVINNGAITGAVGILIAGEGNVVDNGSITGTKSVGIEFSGDGTVTVRPNMSVGGQSAAITNAGNTPGLVSNAGLITALDADGKGVEFNLLGGAIANVGAISGLDNGVDSDGLTIIANAGAITGGIGAGVEIGASGVVETTGSILGSEGVSIAQLGQVTNIALITATLQAGVSIGYGGEALNIGKIIGVTDGVEISGAPGSVTNIGSISASAAAGVGVSIEDGGSVSNAADGASISGADTGVEGGAGTTVSNKGSISGKGGEGVSISGAGSVTSSHSISGAAGVSIDGQGQFSNSGTITASDTIAVSLGEGGSAVNDANAALTGVTGGLIINNDAGEAVNLGSITASGSTSYGVELSAGGSLENGFGAAITGGEYGVLTEGAAATIQNDGSISGAIGVDLGAGGTLVNAGAIASSAGASGVAVQLAASDCTLIENPGATLTGGVGGFAAGDVIELGVDPTVVNGYETSPGPNGMTTLTLTANGAGVASINLIGSVGTTFSIYQTPGSSLVEITLGAVSTTVNFSTFESQQSSLNQTSGGFDVSDRQSNLVGGMNALNSDAAHIDWISATDAPVTVNVATALADRAALDKVLGGYSISDQAASIQQDFASLATDTAHIAAIAALNGPVTASVATVEADEAALGKITGGFAVSDTASAVSGALTQLQADAGDILSVTATGGKVLVDAADVGPDQAILAKIAGGYRISGLSADDQINLPSLAYESSYQAAFFGGTAGGTLEILDFSAGGQIVATLKLAQAPAGLVSLAANPTEGTDISVESDPLAQPAEGDVLISNIRGQAYPAYQNNYVAGTYTGVSFFYTQPPSGAAYSDYEYDYSAGGAFIGSRFFYPAASGADYSGIEYDYDGAGKLVRALFTGVTGQLYSSYAYDYVGGVLAGSEFDYTEAPSSAGYSSYTIDYGADGSFAGEQFFFDNIAGQSYTGEEEDFDQNVKLSRVVLTGVENQAYSSLELDYSAGTYEGYKAFYDVSGRSYTNEEVDVTASGQLEKVVYSGMTSTPYSSVEQDYSGGSLADTIYGYTDVAGQTYSAYQVKEGASGDPLTETFDLNSGGHTLVALASGQTLTSLGDDRMTGSSTGSTTFVFNAVYGADAIANLTSADMVSLPSSEFANFAALQAAAARSGANVEITASDGDTLTLKNMTLGTLAGMSSHFTFHA